MPDNPRIHSPVRHRNRLLPIAIGLCFFTAFSAPIGAAERGTELMDKVKENSQYHKNQQSVVELTIFDDRERKKVRKFKHLYKVFNKYSRSLIKFFEPASLRLTSLLTESREGKTQTSQWMYLPSFRSTRRLSTRDKNQSFMGSDFTNDDIGGREVTRDAHRVVSENAKVAKVVSIPKDKKDIYSKLEVSIDKSTWVPSRVRFYDRKGELLKTLVNEVVEPMGEVYLSTKVVVENHQSGGRTVLQRTELDVTSSIHANDVGQRALGR